MTPEEELELRKVYKHTRKANKCPWYSDLWSRAIIHKYDGQSRQRDIKRYLRPTGARVGDMAALLNWVPSVLLGSPKATADYNSMRAVLLELTGEPKSLAPKAAPPLDWDERMWSR